MIRFHGETVDFQESSQPLSSLWGATISNTVRPDLQSLPKDGVNVYLNQAQRKLLDSLESTDKDKGRAGREGARVGVVQKSQFVTRCTALPLRPKRPVGRRSRKPRYSDSTSMPSPGIWEWSALPSLKSPWQIAPLQSASATKTCQDSGSGWTTNQPGLARVTHSLFIGGHTLLDNNKSTMERNMR